MSGSTSSGDDIEAGRLNYAESTTVVQGDRPSELDVPFNGLAVFEAGPRRDDRRPNGPVSGVLGRGWNGNGVSGSSTPGAGVVGIGAPNRGPGLVGLGGGHRISSTFLGSPGNLGEEGLGGTGAIGIGGPGDASFDPSHGDATAEVPSRPGAGMVGQGGTAFFRAPIAGSPDPGIGNGPGVVGIAGGRRRPPEADLTQADLAATANVGVVGFGGDGPKPVSVGGPFVGPQSAGAGMLGVGGVATEPGTSSRLGGPGVVGVAGTAVVPADGTLPEVGVAGISSTGFGVSGASVIQAGVSGTPASGPGVAGGSTSGVGVAGGSTSDVGGYFSSATVAQIHLEPHRDPLDDPNGSIAGRTGDLLVLRTPRERQIATLWFCRTSGDASAAIWIKLA
ncbi:MAG: hypothetical protein IT305_01230 [Chloroflexi bacterium]|nr:hypothetical protein [Chloroflexota bacterium]